jgi:hypothetical protein
MRETMGTPRRVLEFVERLEARITDRLSGRTDAVLAYSGGLPSTLVAMVARKRCDLVCVVAGREDSQDVRAAKAAKAHLDYRVHSVRLDLEGTLRIRERMEAANPRLSPSAVRALIPIRAVVEETPNNLILAGVGTQRTDAKIATVLRAWGVQCPLMDLSRSRPPPRSLLRAAAMFLGLPVAWARVAHRSPVTGAGVDELLRSTGPSRR